jgi:hypothetical protein
MVDMTQGLRKAIIATAAVPEAARDAGKNRKANHGSQE